MIAKSQENWEVGERCLLNGELNAAANRLYYAVFQAVLGWARFANKSFDEKNCIHSAMYRFVANEGKSKVVYGKNLIKLRTLRETADYAPESPHRHKIEEVLNTSKEMME